MSTTVVNNLLPGQIASNTLADEFLEDFEDSGSDEESVNNKNNNDEDAALADLMEVDTRVYDDPKEVSKLLNSTELTELLKQVNHFLEEGTKETTGNFEDDPEFDVVVKANKMAARIQDEIQALHKFIRDHYNKKFPELESLVQHPLDYARTVKRVGNQTDVTKVDLVDILPASSIITISLSASSSAGKQLPEDELHKVFEGCDMALALDEARKTILRYVESRMTNYAPNLTEIVGSEVSARLIGLAGGLTALSKMPSSTIMNLGSKKKSLEGFSSSTAVNHFGYVYECDFVKRSAPDYRTKACRLVAGKCTLAARVDSFHESQNGEIGRNLKAEIEKKLDKWHEPPPVRKEKPLAAPDEKKKPRRGGRKARKMKERYGMTEMRKQANRMSFGPEQSDGFDFSNRLGVDKDLGLVGKSGSGSVRLRVIDGKGMKIKAKKLKQLNTSTSGLATSVYAMTPAQGLTLADPELQKKRVQEANEKYFSSTSGFSKVAKK